VKGQEGTLLEGNALSLSQTDSRAAFRASRPSHERVKCANEMRPNLNHLYNTPVSEQARSHSMKIKKQQTLFLRGLIETMEESDTTQGSNAARESNIFVCKSRNATTSFGLSVARTPACFLLLITVTKPPVRFMKNQLLLLFDAKEPRVRKTARSAL